MRPFIILFTSIILFLNTSCENEPYEDLTTSFQGIVYQGPEEPLANGAIVIVGSRSLFDESPGEGFRQTFTTESDGTFNIRVTTDDIASFSIDMPSSDQRCLGPTISGVCTLMEAGEAHKDISIYTYID